MRHIGRLVLFSAMVAGCSDYTVTFDRTPGYVPDPGSVAGRVCDPTGRSWLVDAMAYTNIYNADGRVIDVRKGYSDRDGYWMLPQMASERQYTIFVQHGMEVLEEHTLWVGDGDDIRLIEPECFDPVSLNIALVTGDYDDIHLVLQNMGFANYTLVDGGDAAALEDFLTDIENLRPYDIVFFNGGHVEEGIIWDISPANEVPEQVVSNLRQFVTEGGSVYASDWAYDVIEQTWPEAVDFLGDDGTPDAAQLGEYDLVDAAVTDESLAAYLGKNVVEIEYDLPVWPPVTAVEGYVSIHLTGTVRYREGTGTYTLASVPLLVTFSGGEGRVGFATFRVAANHGDDMVSILQYMMHELR